MAQQQQQEPQQVDPQLVPPTDYKLGMERAMAQFHASVHVQGFQAYAELIHTLRITSCKLISDLFNAHEGKVLQSIRHPDGQHFKAGFIVHTGASSSRTYSPDFSTEEFDDVTNKLICKLHLEASEVCARMEDIHGKIAILKTKVSVQNFVKNLSALGLPLTTISVMDPAEQEVNVDKLHVCDHMPDPNLLYGNEATQLLGALVRYHMQNILLTTLNAYPMATCEKEFSVSRTKFERVVSGLKQAGGHGYERKRQAADRCLQTKGQEKEPSGQG